MTLREWPPANDDDEDRFVYLVCVDGLKWSVRQYRDGAEIFAYDEKSAARNEAKTQGYIIKQ